MKKRTLSDEEITLLTYCLRKHKPELIEKIEQLDSGLIDSETINKMREAVGDELAGHGFRPDWEPNEYGLKLEDLIDRLADLYLWPDRKKK